MRRMWLATAAIAIALAGCQFNREARADPIESGLDQPFTLPGGQEATIRGENLRLRFAEVLEDSRCPANVECVWTGMARIAVVVQQAPGDPTTVEFTTRPLPGHIVDVGAYTIVLEALDPYPETPEDVFALEDYRATLLVRSN